MDFGYKLAPGGSIFTDRFPDGEEDLFSSRSCAYRPHPAASPFTLSRGITTALDRAMGDKSKRILHEIRIRKSIQEQGLKDALRPEPRCRCGFTHDQVTTLWAVTPRGGRQAVFYCDRCLPREWRYGVP